MHAIRTYACHRDAWLMLLTAPLVMSAFGCAVRSWTITTALKPAPADVPTVERAIVKAASPSAPDSAAGGTAFHVGGALFITAEHAVDRPDDSITLYWRGRALPARVVFRNEPADCAVLEMDHPPIELLRLPVVRLDANPPLHWGSTVYVASYDVPLPDAEGYAPEDKILHMPELTGLASVVFTGSRNADGRNGITMPLTAQLWCGKIVERADTFDSVILDFVGRHGMSGSAVYYLDDARAPCVVGVVRGGGPPTPGDDRSEYPCSFRYSLVNTHPRQELQGALVSLLPTDLVEFIQQQESELQMHDAATVQ